MNETRNVSLYSAPEYLVGLAALIYDKRSRLARSGRPGSVLSLQEVAEQSGVSAPTLSRLERGSVPDLESFRKICIWLGVSTDAILQMPNGE